MGITEYHNKYFPTKHRNSTYRKINKILDELLEEGIVEAKTVNSYQKINILKEDILFEKLLKVKLF